MIVSRSLLSRPEQRLYGRLVRAFPGHVILAQVALLRLLADGDGEGDGDGAARRTLALRCRRMVADFVVFRPDFTALAVVELDPPQSALGARPDDGQDARRRKDRVLRDVGVKVVRLPADDLPTESALRALVAALPLNASAHPLMRRAS